MSHALMHKTRQAIHLAYPPAGIAPSSIAFGMSIGVVDMARRRAIDPIGPPALPVRPLSPLPGSRTKISPAAKMAARQ